MRNIITFFLICISTICFTQNNRFDDIHNSELKLNKKSALNFAELATHFENKGDYNKALICLRKELALSESFSKATIINQIGRMYLYLGNAQYALMSFESALAISEKQGNLKEKAKSLNYIGQFFSHQGSYIKASQYLFSALHIAENLNDSILLSSDYNSLGNLYHLQKNYIQSMQYYNLALQKASVKQQKEKIIIYNNIANIYADQGNSTKALEVYTKALTLSKQAKIDNLIASSLLNIGTLYLDIGDNTKAINYLTQAYKMASDFNETRLLVDVQISLSDAYLNANQTTQAEQSLLSTLSFLKDYSFLKEKLLVEELLTSLYEQNKNYPQAYEHHKAMTDVKDSLFSSETKKELIKQEMLYEFEKKEIIRKSETEKKEALEKSKRTRNTLIFVFVFIICIGTLLQLLRSQKLKNQKDKLLAENTRLLIERQNALLNAEKEELENKLKQSKIELLNFTQNMIEKNELLEQFKEEIETLKNLKSKELYEEKIDKLDYLNKISILTEDDWIKFKELFEQVYKGFFTRLKEQYPTLTQAEIRLCSLIKLNVTSKEMASILGISPNTIKSTRYHLRKKIAINDDISIEQIVATI